MLVTNQELIALLPEFILNSENYYLVVINERGLYSFVNDAFKKRFSFLKDDFINQPSSIGVHPDDFDQCNLIAYQCSQNPGKVYPVQVRKPEDLKGNYFWTNWEFSLLRNNDGAHLGILCIGHDITESEKASRNAKLFAQKVDTIIEEITDGFIALSREWICLKMNQVAADLLNVSRDTQLGQPIWQALPDNPSYQYPAAFRKAMDENTSITFEEYRRDLHKWFSIVCYPSTEGLTIFVKDISKEKFTQKKLSHSETMLRALYDSTSEASTFIDTDLRIQFSNKLAKQICKNIFDAEPELGDCVLDFIIPDYKEEFKDYYQRVLNGESIYKEKEYLGFWWAFSLFPVYDHNNQIVGISDNVKDISTRKENEVTMLKQYETLKRIAWLQSHEVRRPITNIMGMYHILKAADKNTPEENQQYLDHLLDATKELDEIIHKIVRNA